MAAKKNPPMKSKIDQLFSSLPKFSISTVFQKLFGAAKSLTTVAVLTAAALFVTIQSGFMERTSLCPQFLKYCHTDGHIFIDSPEIYTRERLVNDRFLQDAWLREQLDRLDHASFAPQSKTSSDLRLVIVPADSKTSEQPKSVVVADAGNESSKGQIRASKPGQPDRQIDFSGLQQHPEISFRARAAQRDLIRQLVIENQLDDRHDLNGNTLYMAKFDVSVLPRSDSRAAIVEVELHPQDPPLPLRAFPNHIPLYIDIPYSSNYSTNPRWELYTKWLEDERRKFNTITQDLFGRFVAEKPDHNLLKDFYWYMQSVENWGLNYPEILDTIAPSHMPASQDSAPGALQGNPLADRRTSSKLQDFVQGFDDWIRVEDHWSLIRPYVNLFVISRTFEMITDSSSTPQIYFTQLLEKLCAAATTTAYGKVKIGNKEFDAGQSCPYQLAAQKSNNFTPETLFEVLRRDPTFALESVSTGLPFKLFFSWSLNTHKPPQWTLQPKDVVLAVVPQEKCFQTFTQTLNSNSDVGKSYSARYRISVKKDSEPSGEDPQKAGEETAQLFIQSSELHKLNGSVEFIDLNAHPTGYWNTHLDQLVKYILDQKNFEERSLKVEPIFLIPNSFSFENGRPAPKQQYKSLSENCKGIQAKMLNLNTGFYEFMDGSKKQTAFSYATLPRSDHNSAYSSLKHSVDLTINNSLKNLAIPNTNTNVGLDRQKSGLHGQPVLIGYGSESKILSDLKKTVVVKRLQDSGYSVEQIDAKIGDLTAHEFAQLKVPKVGWAIFPGAGNRSGIHSRRLEPVQKSLSALFSVPAWWGSLKLGVNLGWIDQYGEIFFINERGKPQNADGKAGGPAIRRLIEQSPHRGDVANCEFTHCYIVPLPENYASVSDFQNHAAIRVPKISELDTLDQIKVRSCRAASISISGDRLWRNTTVTLGGQIADRIEVLPNMKGVVATFEPVKLYHRLSVDPERLFVADQPVDTSLTVWTSEGKVDYPYPIKVYPPLKEEVQKGDCQWSQTN